LTEEDIYNVALKCEGYSGADLKSLAQEAALFAVREELNILQVSTLRPINESDFMKAIKHTKPSVSQESLKHYDDWNNQFGSFV
jgi:SpoVK/Ycf46/Vps4 family AAA+-type ATPase